MIFVFLTFTLPGSQESTSAFNIGSDPKVDEVENGRRNRLSGFTPGAVRRNMFLKQNSINMEATWEEQGEFMRYFQYPKPNVIMYELLKPRNGVSNRTLNDYQTLCQIQASTKLYLEEQESKELLEEVGLAIARNYLDIHRN